MKVFAISDLHMSINNPKPMDIFGPSWDNYIEEIWADWAQKVADDDIVIIGGDISWAMHLEDAVADLKEIRKNKGKIVMIRGNHDYWWASIGKVRAALPPDMWALQNDALKFDGVIICGTRGWNLPDTKGFNADDQKILDREVLRLEMSLAHAKKLQTNNEKIICVIHYPPFNIRREASPFTKLMEQYGVSWVVYGHLHFPQPKERLQPLIEKNGIKYYLTSCDLVKNKLTEIGY